MTKAAFANACPNLHPKLGASQSFSRRITRSWIPTGTNTPCGDAIRSAKYIVAADGGDAIRSAKREGYAGGGGSCGRRDRQARQALPPPCRQPPKPDRGLYPDGLAILQTHDTPKLSSGLFFLAPLAILNRQQQQQSHARARDQLGKRIIG